MVTKRQTLDAIAALQAGDLPKAVRAIAKAKAGGLPLVVEALRAGFALGKQATKARIHRPKRWGSCAFWRQRQAPRRDSGHSGRALEYLKPRLPIVAASPAPSCPIGSAEKLPCRQQPLTPFAGSLWLALIAVNEHSLLEATSEGFAKRLE
jgi:hypothetical protein